MVEERPSLGPLLTDHTEEQLKLALEASEYTPQNLQDALFLCAKKNLWKCLDVILQYTVDVNFLTDDWTPLMVASSMGHDTIVKRLIEYPNCRINEADEVGRTALHFAIRTYKIGCICLLLDGGADVELVDNEGCTAIWGAMYKAPLCGYQLFKMILQHGCDIEKVNPNLEQTMLDYSIRYKHRETIALLVEAGCQTNPLRKYLEYRYQHTKIKKKEESFLTALVGLTFHARDLLNIAATRVRQCLGSRVPQKVKKLGLNQELVDLVALTHLGRIFRSS